MGSVGAAPVLSPGGDGAAGVDGVVSGPGAKGAAGTVCPGDEGVGSWRRTGAAEGAGAAEPGVDELDGNGEPDCDGGAPEAGADGDEREGELNGDGDGEDDGDGVAAGAGSDSDSSG